MHGLIKVSLAASAAVALGYLGSRHLDPPRHTKETAREPIVVETTLEVEPAARPHATRLTTARITPPPSEPVEPEGEAAPTSSDDPEKEAVEAPTEEERLAYAESVFESEPFDGAWAPRARQEVETKLAALSVKPARLGSVACRTELCRFEIETKNVDEEGNFLREVVRASMGAGMILRGEPGPNGETKGTIFIAPKNTPLPNPPPT